MEEHPEPASTLKGLGSSRLGHSQSAPSFEAAAKSALSKPAPRLIPACFASHRALAGFFREKPELFESPSLAECGVRDNVLQWYPAEYRPKWVTSIAYQQRQVLSQDTLGRRIPNNLKSLQMRQRQQQLLSGGPQRAAGTGTPAGQFPHSFDCARGSPLPPEYKH
eukprot:gnl/MRDRNA2_/MRDRNA2_101013_c0_seq1.p1 gnl/MRDRNA2_/MRDRNA2_101013_c0~~gnl/MRDRNA2_/MRDRNA2_101013_c0_seq1.p1  ORF type:complete len:165 (+),score=24.66 gnl/MRDRNA2_/MRDRNA2_101013_c0_seq1:57-551(+)